MGDWWRFHQPFRDFSYDFGGLAEKKIFSADAKSNFDNLLFMFVGWIWRFLVIVHGSKKERVFARFSPSGLVFRYLPYPWGEGTWDLAAIYEVGGV